MTKFFKRIIYDIPYNFLKVNMYGFPTRCQSESLTLILIHLLSSLLEGVGEGRVNRPTDRRILKIFLPRFRNKSEISTDLRILQKQRFADSSICMFSLINCSENLKTLKSSQFLSDCVKSKYVIRIKSHHTLFEKENNQSK